MTGSEATVTDSPPNRQLTELAAACNEGRDQQAEADARELIRQYPGHPLAWKVLGLVLERSGRSAEALACLDEALRLVPDDANCHNLRGNVLCTLKRQTEACRSYEAALAVAPDAAVLNNLGTALQELGRNDDALVRLEQARQLDPDCVDIHYNIGNALLALGRPVEAEASYLRALARQPGHRRSLVNLAAILKDAGRYGDAELCLKQAVRLAPNDADLQAGMAMLLHDMGRIDESAAACEQGLAIDPGHPDCLVGRARIHADEGRFAEAEADFRQALARRPRMAAALAGLAGLRRMSHADAAWLNDARQALAAPLDRRSASELHFALGKYHDDVGEYDAAFDHYRQANALKKAGRAPFDRQRWATTVDRLIASCPASLLAQPLPGAVDDRRPVFVMGLPRSGTSLVEQIIAAHPRVFGAGELTYWPARLPDPLAGLAPEQHGQLTDIAAGYLHLLEDLAPAAERIVDKLPGNFVRLAQLRLTLPCARFVHVRRHPADTCLSMFFQNLNASHPYATDLGDLAFYYRHYDRLMAHWRHCLPFDALLEVDYEALLDDQEGSSKRLIDFLGLPWDDACLDFANARRRVGTASNWQVRQPIYTSSRARWRNYEMHLGPLQTLFRDSN
jgi:tetratricopeptide (TPR) repeat protein